ncbi:inovirus Gp2 family protein [Pseudomonas oryzihabitans]|uniref:inovirus Gp2 family protein n=1 Tax=Pseudomonas oryzihabitans TaxID=47885 RepID=UPI003B219B9D
MLRHPQNKNLHIHTAELFEGMPLMIDKGPFIAEYLSSLKRTIDNALEQYPRSLGFRVDLRLPVRVNLPSFAYTNQVISKFIESFKAKIEHNRLMARARSRYVHGCRVRYVWAREEVMMGRPHYHLVILVNRDAFNYLGKLQSDNSNMISRMEEAWASALGLTLDQVEGLVEIPENAMYRMDHRSNSARILDLFHRASYLCKAVTKTYGDGQHGFGCSRG